MPRAQAGGSPAPVPRADGEVVEVRGRVLDEDYQPIASKEVVVVAHFSCRIEHGSSGRADNNWLWTDADGRFRLDVPRKLGDECTRELCVYESWRDKPRQGGELDPQCRIDLPTAIADPILDLGDVRLVPLASPKRFNSLSDTALEAAVRARRKQTPFDNERQLEGLLCEIVRRGGAAWETFLGEELKRPMSQRDYGYEDAFMCGDVQVLIALRRTQRKPEPLSISVLAKPRAEGGAAGTILQARLTNSDGAREPVRITHGGGYRSGRLERWRVDVRTAEGDLLPPVKWEYAMGGGLCDGRTLALGDYEEVELPLSHYVAVPEAGSYEVRVSYHDQESIADARDLGNLIYTSSEWTRLEVGPRK